MIEKKYKGERLLEIDNLHGGDCDVPPSIDAAEKYVGYFENCYGEQWVFVGDRKIGEAVVRGGDAGWATEYRVSLKRPCPADLVLEDAEKQWIITCFMAMSNATHEAVASAFAAGDIMATVMDLVTELNKEPTAPAAEHHENNGADGNHRPKEIPEE